MLASFPCTFDSISNLLSVQNPVDTTVVSSAQLSFTINSAFKNPYSGAPLSGFYVQTVNSAGTVIERSNSIALQVNSWATMTTATISRADSQQGVNSLSNLRV